jgi:hypothetical protein
MAEEDRDGKDGKDGKGGGDDSTLLKKQAKEDKNTTSKWEKDKENKPK